MGASSDPTVALQSSGQGPVLAANINVARSFIGVDDIARHHDPDFALLRRLAHGPRVDLLSLNRLGFIWRPAKFGDDGAERLPLIIGRSQIQRGEAATGQG